MPFKARRPTGGFRVMYEYANRLAELGYSVHISYPLITPYMKYRLPYFIRLILSYTEGFSTNQWFKFNPSITKSYIKSVEDKYITDADIVIATWWSNAAKMGKLSPSKGKKINLIQGFEDWEGHHDLLLQSYNMPNTVNVVVASYLEKIVKQYTNNPTVLISNSVNNKEYNISSPIESRSRFSVCMMYSTQEIKGSGYGLKALEIVKEKFPELKVELFGICPAPHHLPDWISYHRDPSDLHSIYNNNAIFITNSLTEGFGLVSVEAMACGCALICTDIPGHREYAIDNETALLVPVKEPETMAKRIINLIDDNDYRIKLAKQGNNYIQSFSWDVAVSKMDELIKQLLAK